MIQTVTEKGFLIPQTDQKRGVHIQMCTAGKQITKIVKTATKPHNEPWSVAIFTIAVAVGTLFYLHVTVGLQNYF